MKARLTAFLMVAMLVAYFYVLTPRIAFLFDQGTLEFTALAIGVLLLPLLGLWMAYANLKFGFRTEKMGKKLAEEGLLPDVSDLPTRPSGRIERAAADEWFNDRKAELEADQDNWRRWYRLAFAYDIAGDRKRARHTMHQALDLAERDGVFARKT
jgi:putative Mn2+ efflux pump MntP